jgi:hypothetical protein
VIVRLAEPAGDVPADGATPGIRDAMLALHDRCSEAELEVIADWPARAGQALTELSARERR